MELITVIKIIIVVIYIAVGLIMEHVFKITEPSIYMLTGVIFGMVLAYVLVKVIKDDSRTSN